MFGYYSRWCAVFALTGYLLGLSAGIDPLTAITMAAGGLIIGLFQAWSRRPRLNHTDYLVAYAVPACLVILTITLTNRVLGLSSLVIALVAGWVIAITAILAIIWAASSRRDAEDRIRRQERFIAGHEPL